MATSNPPSLRFAILGLWLVLLAAGSWWVVAHTRVATDMTAFLPEAHTETERLLLDELRAGPAARTVLIGLEGAPPQRLTQLSKDLAQRLRQHGWVARVANGEHLLSPQEQARLFSYRYLLSPTVRAEQFEAPALQQALQARLRELASPMGPVDKDHITADPTATFRSLLQSWREPEAPATRDGVWFDARAERALLLLQTRASAYDIDAQARALDNLRQTFAALPDRGATRMVLAGPGLYAVASRDATRRETQWLSAGASVAVACILLIAYRSVPVLALGALPLLSGLLFATVAVGLWFGGVHGLTLAFGTTLLGIAIDYPIHIFSHMRGGHAMAAALRRVWPTMRLGVLTTALGFGALIGAGFAGLAQLGLFAVVGLLSAAAVSRWVLPALVPRAWSLPPAPGSFPAGLERLRGRLGLVPALVLALALALWLGRAPMPWQDDLASLSPIPESARLLDQQLRHALGAPEVSHAVVVRAANVEQALRRTEAAGEALARLVQQGALDGFTAASRFLPSARTQLQRRQQLPDAAALQEALDDATEAVPFRADVFVPFQEAVQDARQQPPLRLVDLADTALGARLSSLLFSSSSGWTSVIALVGVRDSEALGRWAQQAGEHVLYLDQRATARDLMTRFRQEGLGRASWSAVVIVLVLALALRSWRDLARVLLPLLLAVLLVLGVLTAAGERISLFNLVALLMVLGAGVDYSLFFNRREADPDERLHTLHALLVCAISTATVFGILAWSDMPVLRAIGATVSLGVAASLLFGLLTARPRTATA